MKRILFVLLFILGGNVFSQNFNRGLHIILQSVDTSYFEEGGLHWSEFSLTPKKYYKVMDLIESDTACGCDIVKDPKNFISYMKETNRYSKEDRKFYKKIIGYLECQMPTYELYMWIDRVQGFGYIVTGSSK